MIPALLYGSETWSTTADDRQKLAVTQRAIERRMAGVKWTDRVSNEQLRAMTKVADVVDLAAKPKKTWAGHLARKTDNRWTRTGTEWLPRPATRWRDSPRNDLGQNWMRLVQDRRFVFYFIAEFIAGFIAGNFKAINISDKIFRSLR